jgi:hypothetical protein
MTTQRRRDVRLIGPAEQLPLPRRETRDNHPRFTVVLNAGKQVRSSLAAAMGVRPPGFSLIGIWKSHERTI